MNKILVNMVILQKMLILNDAKYKKFILKSSWCVTCLFHIIYTHTHIYLETKMLPTLFKIYVFHQENGASNWYHKTFFYHWLMPFQQVYRE